MDREADRIRGLIVETCTGAHSEAALVEGRAELLALAAETVDGEAADDACGQAREIEMALADLEATARTRRAS